MSDTPFQSLAQWLKGQQVGAVFLVPGLQIDPLVAHLAEAAEVETTVAAHELGAGFMADGYARASRGIGVCLGIGGAGAENMLTAAATARADDTPVLFLTGGLPDHLRDIGTFQDPGPCGTDDVALFRAAVGYSATVTSASTFGHFLTTAASVVRGSPPSLAHLSIPFDIQENVRNAGFCPPTTAASAPVVRSHDPMASSGVIQALASGRRVALLAGPRADLPDSADALREFAETYSIPIATTLSAKGLLPETHPLSLGNFGYAGTRRANEALLRDDIDLLVLLGADLNERDSLCWDRRLGPAHRVVVRIDPKLTPPRPGPRARWEVTMDCGTALRSWVNLRNRDLRPLLTSGTERRAWIESLMRVPQQFGALSTMHNDRVSVPLDHVVTALRGELPEDTILVVDAGLQRVFAGRHWTAPRPHSFFSACGLAPLGWAIAAAVGVKMARPHEPVVVLTGDGCMRAQGMELATMVQHELPIIVVVCDNGAYGSVHRRYGDCPAAAELALLPMIDWSQFARSMGAASASVRTLRGLRVALRRAVRDVISSAAARGRPHLIRVATPLDQGIPSPESIPAALVHVKDRPQ